MIIEFDVIGKLKPKQSARFYNNAYGQIRSYQKQDVIDSQRLIKYSFKKVAPDFDYEHNEQVIIDILIGVKIPDSWSNKKRLQALNDEIKPLVKPDVDNYTKGILDSLNGVAYKDDKQVIKLTVEKRYATQYITRIKLTIGKG